MTRFATMLAAAFALVLTTCTPHPDTVRRALLLRGLDSIRLGEADFNCVAFVARRASGGEVSGSVCCTRLSCHVVEAGPQDR